MASRDELYNQYIEQGYSPAAAQALSQSVSDFQQGNYRLPDPDKAESRQARNEMLGSLGGVGGIIGGNYLMGGDMAAKLGAGVSSAGSKLASALGLGGGGAGASAGAGAGSVAGGSLAAPEIVSATRLAGAGLGNAGAGALAGEAAGTAGLAGMGNLAVAGPIGLALLAMATGPQWAPKVAGALGGLSRKVFGSKKKQPTDWDMQKAFASLQDEGFFDQINNTAIGNREKALGVGAGTGKGMSGLGGDTFAGKKVMNWNDMARNLLRQQAFKRQFGDVRGEEALNAVRDFYGSQGKNPDALNLSDFDMLNRNRQKVGLKQYGSPDEVNDFVRQSLRQPGESLEEALL